jgi:hypothetical protein
LCLFFACFLCSSFSRCTPAIELACMAVVTPPCLRQPPLLFLKLLLLCPN